MSKILIAFGLMLMFLPVLFRQSPVSAIATEDAVIQTMTFAEIESDAAVIPCYFVGGVCSRGRYEFLGQDEYLSREWNGGKWAQKAPRSGSYWVRFVVGDTVVSTEFIEGSMR